VDDWQAFDELGSADIGIFRVGVWFAWWFLWQRDNLWPILIQFLRSCGCAISMASDASLVSVPGDSSETALAILLKTSGYLSG
jgi:hypothetical protein